MSGTNVHLSGIGDQISFNRLVNNGNGGWQSKQEVLGIRPVLSASENGYVGVRDRVLCAKDQIDRLLRQMLLSNQKFQFSRTRWFTG